MIDLITGHQGVPHISAEQVSTINNVMMYGYGQDAIVRLKDGDISKDGLEVLFSAGYWRANGYDVQITENDSVILDPTSEGMSRIDVIYGEILQDIPSGVQRFELIVVQGEEAATPTEPPVPIEPQLTTDTLILAVPVAKCTVTESTMTILDQTLPIQMPESGATIKYASLTNMDDEQIKYAYTQNNDFEYKKGNAIFCYMGYGNTAKDPSLSVDDGPAKKITAIGNTSPELFWAATEIALFVYDNDRFCLVAMSSLVNLFSKSLTDIYATGLTNNSGQTINAGEFFYKDRTLCAALQQINTNNSLTENTNYITIPDGALNYLRGMISDLDEKIITFYGSSSTYQSTSGKTVTTSGGNFVKKNGNKVRIYFSNANTAAAPYLSVDGTGAHYIKSSGEEKPKIWWKAGEVVEFTYYNSNYVMTPSQEQITSLATGLTNISVPASTNNTGSTINKGTFFYKQGTLVRALTNIASSATLTENTNYEVVTAGGLNALNDALNDVQTLQTVERVADVTSTTKTAAIDYSLYSEIILTVIYASGTSENLMNFRVQADYFKNVMNYFIPTTGNYINSGSMIGATILFDTNRQFSLAMVVVNNNNVTASARLIVDAIRKP